MKNLSCFQFLLGLVLLLGSMTFASGEPIEFVSCCAPLDRAVREHVAFYEGPLIDGHAHLDPESSKSYRNDMLAVISDGVVDGLILMPTPNHGRMIGGHSIKQMTDLATQSDGAISTFCAGSDWNNWMGRQLSVSDAGLEKRKTRLLAQLESGACRGIGEIATRHFEKWSGQAILTVDFRSRALHQLFVIAENYKMPIDLHVEPMDQRISHERSTFSDLDEIFNRYPDITVILAHTAMTNVANVERMIQRYPRLYFSVKSIGKPRYWYNLEPVNFSKKRKAWFYEDWAQLLESHPDRFFIGSDYKFARKLRNSPGGNKSVKKYTKFVKRYRVLLGSLDPQAAQQIAWDTPRKLFGME